MKKVEITKSCSGIRFTFQQGEVVDIDDRLADDLIRAKFAIAVDIGETADSESVDGETADSESVDGETADSESVDGETADSESVDGETVAEDEKKPVRRRRATQKDVQDDVG